MLSNNHLGNVLAVSSWWYGMYTDATKHWKNSPQCSLRSEVRSVEIRTYEVD